MTIWWVDPYLESAHGGIHGTTSNGAGTYSSPLTPTQLRTNSVGIADGDEIRFKGLPESTFFDTQVSFSYVDNTRYELMGAQNKFVRVKTNNSGTERFMYGFTEPNNGYNIHRSDSYNFWATMIGQLDETYGAYVFNDDYRLVNGQNGFVTNEYFFNSLQVKATITSGWTSETEQTGVTALVFVPQGNSLYLVEGGGGGHLRIQCPEMIIGCKYNNLQIQANYIELKAIAGSFYAPGYNIDLFCFNSFGVPNSGTIKVIDSVQTGGYLNLRIDQPSSPKAVIDIPAIFTGYYCVLVAAWISPTPLDIKITEYYGWNALDFANGNSPDTSVYLGNNYLFYSYNSASNFNIGPAFIINNEYIGTPGIPNGAYNNSYYNNFTHLGVPNTNISILNVQPLVYYSKQDSLFSIGSVDYSGFRNLVKTLEHTETKLENITFNIAKSTGASQAGIPTKVNILGDSAQNRPCQLMSCTSINDGSKGALLAYSSPDYGNSLVWHFLPNTKNSTYSDTFAIDVPDFTNNSLQFNVDIESSNPDPGVSLSVDLMVCDVAQGIYTLLTFTNISLVNNHFIASQVVNNLGTFGTWGHVTVYAVVHASRTSGNNTSVTKLAFRDMSFSQV